MEFQFTRFIHSNKFFETHPTNNNEFMELSSHFYHRAKYNNDELVAERRRKNAKASARFRDRKRKSEKEMQVKCQLLEKKVRELESRDNFKRVSELEKKIEDSLESEKVLNFKLQEQEIEVLYSKSHVTYSLQILISL